MAGTTQQHIPERLAYFTTLPNEELLLIERKHWFVLLREIIILLFLSFPFYGVLFLLLTYFFQYPKGFVSAILVLSYILLSLVIKTIIEWHLHVFIVSNRRILEIWYSPLFFYKTNGVLLDQVRCTEIDEQKSGMLNEIIDMGNIIITFDRPTHRDEFILTDVKNPEKVANILSNIFSSLEKNTSFPIWYKPHEKQTVTLLSGKGGDKHE